MGLKQCTVCKEYNLTNICRKCGSECLDSGYKFKQIRDAPKDSSKYFTEKRKHENS